MNDEIAGLKALLRFSISHPTPYPSKNLSNKCVAWPVGITRNQGYPTQVLQTVTGPILTEPSVLS